jgi:hypothetical protein
MATLTLEYNAKNYTAKRIIEIILTMDDIFKVKNVAAKQIPDKKEAAAAFLGKWAGKFTVNEKNTDDARYNYLVEKYR